MSIHATMPFGPVTEPTKWRHCPRNAPNGADGSDLNGSNAARSRDRHNHPMNSAFRKPILTIPNETEGSAAFRARLATLLLEPGTHIYVDTSFLMWMTKIGSVSRRELTDWLHANCAGRVHVPIWSAHEYLKHHVAGTIVTELSKKAEEVADLVGRTYTYFRPFIDEASGEGAEDAAALRATTRAALNSLDRLADIGRLWHRSYQRHASEVIAFINARTPETTTVFGVVDDISSSGAGRFTGSIPPGYQDRHKKGSGPSVKGSEADAPPDSNRYGDLVFWKELLDHAKTVAAKAIVVLTNDRKNDWHLGRSERIDIDPVLLALKKAWRPVPRAHPMLEMEAKLTAGVEQVELLDSPYLAALLRDLAEDDLACFTDVAIIPDGPKADDEDERRAQLLGDRMAEDARRSGMAAEEGGYLFADPDRVLNSPGSFLRALRESREAVDAEGERLLAAWRSSVEAKSPLSQTITEETFAAYDHKALAKLARELHDRVVAGEPGYLEAAADLTSILGRLPPNVAASLYLGLLSSVYLERATNASRRPPSSPLLDFVFGAQSADYAVNGVRIVAKRLGDNEGRPLYVPDAAKPPLRIAFDTEPHSPASDQLRSLRVGDVELLNPAQVDPDLNLGALFGRETPVGSDALVRKACELFALPFDQIDRSDASGSTYVLTQTIGFKRPEDILIPKDRSDGE